jgi:hypothetical protein
MGLKRGIVVFYAVLIGVLSILSAVYIFLNLRVFQPEEDARTRQRDRRSGQSGSGYYDVEEGRMVYFSENVTPPVPTEAHVVYIPQTEEVPATDVAVMHTTQDSDDADEEKSTPKNFFDNSLN